MISSQASTKEAPTMPSLTTTIVPVYSSTDNGYWTGKEVQFIIFMYIRIKFKDKLLIFCLLMSKTKLCFEFE